MTATGSQWQSNESFAAIIHLGKQLNCQINESSFIELNEKLSVYIKLIEQHFFKQQQKSHLSETELGQLQELMSAHQSMIKLFNQEKAKVSNNLKQLQAGKKMQTAYP